MSIPEAHERILGRYRLTALLGEGGMGKVYRGFDTTLERSVAIKLLPPELVADASRLGRFIQEARAASALNHPNVITVYDIGEELLGGESERVRYIAMELVDGGTLRDAMNAERLDLRKGLKIAIQIAEGLSAAHAAGIVHRDVKPENVMINAAGHVKVLDFGLAKLRIRAESANPDDSRTIEKGSEPGTVMGTVGYMSPEQAQGRPVDTRTDVFSFGCILYELASGRRAFQGDSSVDTLHKIIYSDPVPLRELRADVPPELARIVRKTLAKDVDERYQSLKEVSIDLRDLLREIDSNPSGVSGVTAIASPAGPRRGWLIPAGIAIAVIAIAGLSFMLWRRSKSPARLIEAQSIQINRITANGKVIEAAISPDGRFTAYVVSDQGRQTVILRDMTSGQTLTLIPPQPTAYWGLAFTRDGSSIYFGLKDRANPGGAMFQISVIGGQPRKILDVMDSQPTFSPDGKQMAFLRAAFPTRDESAVVIANADGSGLRTLAKVHAPEFFVPIFFAGASWSPDGKMIATSISGKEQTRTSSYFAIEPVNHAARIVGIDVATGAMKTISGHDWSSIAQVAWMPDQKGLVAIASLSTSRSSQVWYIPYPSGDPQPITRDLFDYRIVTLTADGKSLLTVASDVNADVWIVRDGAAPRRINGSRAEGIYGVAPVGDGRLVTTSIETGKLDLFVINEDGTGRTQLTHDEYSNRSPVVTPDGKRVVYLAVTPKGSEVCRVNMDGSDRKILARTGSATAFIDVSRDGRTVVFEDVFASEGGDSRGALDRASGRFGFFKVSIDGGPSSPLGPEGFGIPVFSPDGSKIAGFSSDNHDLVTMPAGGGPATKVMEWATSSYSLARWAPDGKALVVNTVEGDRANLWLVPLDGKPRRKLTNFDEHLLFTFAPLADGKGWALTRGDLSRDAVLITGFRPPS